MDENPDINNHPELKQGIRQFLLEIVEQYYEKDDDLIVLQNMNDDPPQVDYINEVKKKIRWRYIKWEKSFPPLKDFSFKAREYDLLFHKEIITIRFIAIHEKSI